MRPITTIHAALLGLFLAAACCAAPEEREKPPPPSEEDWQEALSAIRQIALDAEQAEEHRANAVTAYVKLLLRRRRHDDALAFCREVLKQASRTAVIDAALRGGCFVERDRHGHLRGELDFLASCSRGPGGPAASAIRRDLDQAAQRLAALAGRKIPPDPVVPRFPHWAAAGPGKAPSALHVNLPGFQPPGWYGRVAFPLLKQPKK